MKKNEILNIILCVILAGVGLYLAVKLIKWAWGLFLAGTSILLVLAYIFAPVIIIVLLIMIFIRMGRRR